MKQLVLTILFLFTQGIYAQTLHPVLVKVNQPAECVTSNIQNIDSEINIYPNPAKQSFRIQSRYTLNTVWIIDTTGRTVYSTRTQGTQSNIDVQTLVPGIYQCIIEHSKGIKRNKLILQ